MNIDAQIARIENHIRQGARNLKGVYSKGHIAAALDGLSNLKVDLFEQQSSAEDRCARLTKDLAELKAELKHAKCRGLEIESKSLENIVIDLATMRDEILRQSGRITEERKRIREETTA